jgi:hypothetical protein
MQIMQVFDPNRNSTLMKRVVFAALRCMQGAGAVVKGEFKQKVEKFHRVNKG